MNSESQYQAEGGVEPAGGGQDDDRGRINQENRATAFDEPLNHEEVSVLVVVINPPV